MKIERLRKIALHLGDKDITKNNINDVPEEELMKKIVFHCMDELEMGDWWEEPADVIYDLGVNDKEAEEIMAQIPDYFGDEEEVEE